MRALILCVALVALLLTEGCEGKTPREPDIGEQPSSGSAPETLYLSLFFPHSGGLEYRWDGAMLVLKKKIRNPGCPPRVEDFAVGGRLALVLG